MSGGLDSSVAAAMLKEQGYDAIGFTAHLWHGGSRCCSDADIRDAQRVAAFLGIPHYVLDLRQPFQRDVVCYFVAEYTRARTPSPCVVCNQRIKFGVLLDRAVQAGASHLATGHYARMTDGPDGVPVLRRGADPDKDQSYFLFSLTREQRERCFFPLGDMTKRETIARARALGLPLRDKPESQELCFVDGDGHPAFIEANCPDARRPGDIVDQSGRALARHDGVHRYTIGQRRGLGLAAGTPLYVSALDGERNRVVVGERDSLMRRDMRVEHIVWSGAPAGADFRARVQIRYRHDGAGAMVTLRDGGRAEVAFDEPQFAVTPGQAAVFYDGDRVQGGGWIGGLAAGTN